MEKCNLTLTQFFSSTACSYGESELTIPGPWNWGSYTEFSLEDDFPAVISIHVHCRGGGGAEHQQAEEENFTPMLFS